MKAVVLAVLAVLAMPPVCAAGSTPPTEESVDRLFAAMHTSQLLESYVQQVDTNMHEAMRQALHGAQLNAEQQQILDDMSSELMQMVRKEVNWESMRPRMVALYRNTFTQQEVDDLLKFYRSSTGQAVVSKLPGAMMQSMQAMQQHLTMLMPQIMQLQRETLSALQRAQERAARAPAQPSQAESQQLPQAPPAAVPAPLTPK